jgi:hypothetical protein
MFINLNVRHNVPKCHNTTAVKNSKPIKPKWNLKFHNKPAPNPRKLSYKGYSISVHKKKWQVIRLNNKPPIVPREEYKELDLHYLMYTSDWYKVLMPTISLYVPWYLPASFRKLLATMKADNNVLLWFALITAMLYFSASESLPKWSRSLTLTWSATVSRTR